MISQVAHRNLLQWNWQCHVTQETINILDVTWFFKWKLKWNDGFPEMIFELNRSDFQNFFSHHQIFEDFLSISIRKANFIIFSSNWILKWEIQLKLSHQKLIKKHRVAFRYWISIINGNCILMDTCSISNINPI
jgi:hypothetical protein